MLEVRDLVFSYHKKERKILDHVSFCIEAGERVGLNAPSGYGKTTLLKIIGGYQKADSGEVFVDGSPLPQKGFCPVQMIWQHPEKAVNPRLKMREVIKEGNGIGERLIAGLGIEKDWENRYPQELSGGELQRFCIARALGEGTKYLLADEISTMLDPITQGQIWNFLMRETRERGIGMLIVSHSHELLEYTCDRQIDLQKLQRKTASGVN